MARIRELLERMGDRPAWMRVKKYRESGKRAELVLSLGPYKNRKDYWFPLTPSVYRKFSYHITESRSRGLKYIQSYIRRYRGYAGTWPDAQYVESNKIAGKKSLITEAPIAWEVAKLYQEGSTISDLSSATNLPEELLVSVLKVQGVYLPDDSV